MSGSKPEVIKIEDSDVEDDVEVVFNNLDKSHVYRNLMHQKISQQIELLQAINKQTMPNNFNQFKDIAKKLDCRYGDDVIESAWQRVVNKLLVRLSKSRCNSSPVCLVRPLQHPSSPSLLPIAASSPVLDSKVSSAVPVALLLNKNSSKNISNYVHGTKVNVDGVSDELSSKSCHTEEIALESSCQLDPVCPADEVSNKKSSRKSRKTVSDSLWLDSNQSNVSNVSEVSNEAQSSCLNSSESYSDSVLPESNVKEKVTKKRGRRSKSSSEQAVSEDSQKTVDKIVSVSHIGVKAKIIKDNSPIQSKKRPSVTWKEMSDADLKKFKAEQKRLKLEEKREFEIQQLQKVHDRLVDVLIPKYYKKKVS